jgi:glycosyltransferase involved in cell wall biosynthesis
MRALVIAPQPFFSPRGTPFSVYYRTLITAELGVKIDLLTYGEGEDVDIEGVRIIRIPHLPFLGPVKVGPSHLKIFLDLFIVAYATRLLLRRRYDFVHAHEESVFFCRFLKPIFGFKLVYDMHSSLPQQLTNFNFTKSKFWIALFKKLEDSCLRSSDVVITICPDLAEYVQRLKKKSLKHFLIENSIFEPVRLSDSNPEKDPKPHVDVKRKLKLTENVHLIVYAGTLEPYQGITILIEALPIVLEKDKNAFLLIVGGSTEQVAHYRKLADDLGLNGHVSFTGRVSQNMAKQYCAAASVLVSPRSEGTNTPLKVYEQLASGIPLVATGIHSHTQVLDSDVAFLVKPEPSDMARGILAALGPEREAQRIAGNAKKLYEAKYSRAVYTDKMKRLLETLF